MQLFISKAVLLLPFFVCASVVSYVVFVMSIFVPHLSFFWCLGWAVLRVCCISRVSDVSSNSKPDPVQKVSVGKARNGYTFRDGKQVNTVSLCFPFEKGQLWEQFFSFGVLYFSGRN